VQPKEEPFGNKWHQQFYEYFIPLGKNWKYEE
jgi:hypothetical protein